MCTEQVCPQCESKNVVIDYGPEFNLLQDDQITIGYLCNDCLHIWAKNYKLVQVEDD